MSDKQEKDKVVVSKEQVKDVAKQAAESNAILGYWIYWDCSMVRINRTDFLNLLRACDLSDEHAKEIKGTTTFKRVIETLEEDKAITQIDNTPGQIVYQIDTIETEEDASDSTVNKAVKYTKDSKIAILKEHVKSDDPNLFIWSDNAQLREQAVKMFNDTRDLYTTTEFRKYLKRLFSSEADLVRMRKAGGVYFAPPESEELGEKVIKLFDMIPGDNYFDFVPMPDGTNGRKALKRAVVDEAMSTIEELTSKIEELEQDDTRTERRKNTFAENRLSEIEKLRSRIHMYHVYLDSKAKDILDSVQGLENRAKDYLLGNSG